MDIRNEKTERIDSYLKELNEKLDCVKSLVKYVKLPEKTVEKMGYSGYWQYEENTAEYKCSENYYVSYKPSKTNFQENIRIIRSMLQDISNSLEGIDLYVGSISVKSEEK